MDSQCVNRVEQPPEDFADGANTHDAAPFDDAAVLDERHLPVEFCGAVKYHQKQVSPYGRAAHLRILWRQGTDAVIFAYGWSRKRASLGQDARGKAK
jgi:hypothetical protein